MSYVKRRILLLILFVAVVTCTFVLAYRPVSAPKNEQSKKSADTNKAQTQTPTTPAFDKKKYSIDDPASIWVIVNKKRSLPANYAPGDLLPGSIRREAADNLSKLLAAAQKNGTPLKIISGYRSYSNQVSTYNNYVKKDGQAAADTYSARPGHSEHQTGWAADLGNGTCDLDICFGQTSAGAWLATHAHEYGFIIRYEKGKESLTGYQYEPWHVRYVGGELADELFKTSQTMEQFFGLDPATTY